MKRKPTKQPSLASLATKTGISLSTLKRYTRAGVDVFDPASLRKHAGGNKHAPKALEAPDLRAAKLKKTLLECERIAFALDCERKLFVPVQAVQGDLVRIGATLRAEVRRFVGDLGTFEGLPAAEMHRRGMVWMDGLCKVLSDSKSYEKH